MNSTESSWIVIETLGHFEAHMLEHGSMRFQVAEAVGPFSIHPFGIVSGQQICSPEITIAAQTRVLFKNNITKNHSGVYSGVPGTECRASKVLSSVATLLEKEGTA